MVNSVTSLTGNGLKDWLIQRVTAVYLLVYTLGFLIFFVCNIPLEYSVLKHLFSALWFKISSLVALLAISLHAWIGIWTVTTDYMKCTVLRFGIQMLVVLWLLVQFVWGVLIIWGQS